MKIALIALTCASLQIIDGDSLRCNGQSIRLTMYDTPETWRPRCLEEYSLGMQAKWRLQEFVASGHWRIQLQPFRDKYDRLLGELFIWRVPVADIMIREGMARSLDWEAGERRKGWC